MTRNSPFLLIAKAIQRGSLEHCIPEMQEGNGNIGGCEKAEKECISSGWSELDLRGKEGKGKKEKERTEELKDKGREEKERR